MLVAITIITHILDRSHEATPAQRAQQLALQMARAHQTHEEGDGHMRVDALQSCRNGNDRLVCQGVGRLDI